MASAPSEWAGSGNRYAITSRDFQLKGMGRPGILDLLVGNTPPGSAPKPPMVAMKPTSAHEHQHDRELLI